MSEFFRKYEGIFAAAVAAAAVLFLVGTADFEAFDYDEAIYCASVREMLESREWALPSFNYSKFYEKPPLFYWLTAAAAEFLPVKSISHAGRVVAAAAAAGTTLVIYLFASYFFGRSAAGWSAAVFATSFGTAAMSRAILTDGVFVLFFTLSAFSGAVYVETRKRAFSALFWTAAAFSMLAKGPAGPALAGVSVFAYALVVRKNLLRASAVFFEPLGIALFLAVSLPWHIAAQIKSGGEFFRDFFIKHNLARFGARAFEGHSGGLYYYMPVALLWMFPWSAFLPEAIAAVRKNRALIFFAACAAAPFVLFSFSRTKLPNYAAPIFPPLAVMTGYFIAGFISGEIAVSPKMRAASLVVVTLAAAVITGVFWGAEGYANANAAKFSADAPFLADGIALGRPMKAVAAAAVAAAGCCFLFFNKKRARRAAAAMAIAGAAISLFIPRAAERVWSDAQRPLKNLAVEAASEARAIGPKSGANIPEQAGQIVAYELSMSPSISLHAARKILYVGKGEKHLVGRMKKAGLNPIVLVKRADYERDLKPLGFRTIREESGYAIAR